jgi:hypothetical protein
MPQDTPILEAQPLAAPELTGSEDEAMAAFAALEAKKTGETAEEAKTEDPEPADEAAEAEEPEAEQAEPEPEAPAEELTEVEIGGKTYKVAPEVEKAILRQADYSRKMNEVGAKAKAFDERMVVAEELASGAEKRAEALADVRSIDKDIAKYDGIDWAKAKAANPAEAAMAAIELMTLRDQRKDAVQAAATVARDLTEQRNKLLDIARTEMDAELMKNLKGWGDELGKTITRYALDAKIERKTLEALTDPALVIALDKARRFDALQGEKKTLQAKAVEAPKVVRPGSPVRRIDPTIEAAARFKKSGSEQDGYALLLARQKRG